LCGVEQVHRVKLPFHIEVEAISGAQVHHLHKAWKETFGNTKTPIDTIALCGLNDVTKLSPHQFGGILQDWNDDVKVLNPDNTLRVCKMLMPPMYAWLPGDGDLPVGYRNRIDTINAFNNIIQDLNEFHGFTNVPGFSREGVRANNGTLCHIWSSWREINKSKSKCLHLKDDKRADMLQKIVTYIGNNMNPIH